MANRPNPKTRPISSAKPQKPVSKRSRITGWLVASSWLIMASIVAAAAAVLWMTEPEAVEQAHTFNEAEQLEQGIPSNVRQVTYVEPLHELDNEVHPVSFDALIRDLRDYPDEFVDAGYLKKNKGKWTIQVMDVAEHEVVTDYLNLRDDREKFAYFRYRDGDNQVRYVVTYEALASPQLALGVAKTVDFGLPENVRVLPEEIDNYVSIIENYELSQPLRDLSKTRPRRVRLQPTQRELAARRRATEHDNETTRPPANSVPADGTRSSRDIEESHDSNDTLAVTEQRQVVVPNNSRETTSSSNNDTVSATSNTSANANERASQSSRGNNNGVQTATVPAQSTSTNQTNRAQPNNGSTNSGSTNSGSISNRPAPPVTTPAPPVATPTPPATSQAPASNDAIAELIEDRNKEAVSY